MIEVWYQTTYDSLLGLWKGFLNFIPSLLAAIIVFVIGWFIAEVIGKLVARILKVLKLNQIFDRANWKEALEAAEIKVNISEFIGGICKWVLVVVFLSVSVEILGLSQFASLLNRLISWLPNLIVAVAIFVVAIIVADILNRLIRASVKKIGVKYGGFLSALVRWAIYIFAGLAILLQLGVTPTIIQTIIVGFVGMIALALGLSFGLGGKDAAAKLIEDFKKKISEE
ncbi:MAG: hypothetical protein COW25_00350 [Candidatus Nealsonbacteria bacterium CG15_BIG_FIL_POST_REV_8_21_14_020_37_12]|uniref:Small-conductance mechanosensitive ion channel n=2 Tax=Candidatus Nealsoniibacteriota TaxID=1817911 RepID=A0A2M7H1V7_9BACT|nr:MAG: hypothetical protein COW25_00350 [Candidatus Nealsonbacteria bacterium CG15_BIG_FIL_POST_REV_8_21_14_020_37_12]PJB99581.1 MAG: hypothetical protein CO077_00990 [Candidatus Nealsonbacteria bacterium CG_4_9_14_0_8_um_filter_35_12]